MKNKMTEQEENWLLMTTLHMPWNQVKEITDPEDRKFLLDKASEIQGFIEKQQQEQQRQQRVMQQQPQPEQLDSSVQL